MMGAEEKVAVQVVSVRGRKYGVVVDEEAFRRRSASAEVAWDDLVLPSDLEVPPARVEERPVLAEHKHGSLMLVLDEDEYRALDDAEPEGGWGLRLARTLIVEQSASTEGLSNVQGVYDFCVWLPTSDSLWHAAEALLDHYAGGVGGAKRLSNKWKVLTVSQRRALLRVVHLLAGTNGKVHGAVASADRWKPALEFVMTAHADTNEVLREIGGRWRTCYQGQKGA